MRWKTDFKEVFLQQFLPCVIILSYFEISPLKYVLIAFLKYFLSSLCLFLIPSAQTMIYLGVVDKQK